MILIIFFYFNFLFSSLFYLLDSQKNIGGIVLRTTVKQLSGPGFGNIAAWLKFLIFIFS